MSFSRRKVAGPGKCLGTLKCLLCVIIFLSVVWYLHVESYVWQVTSMRSYLTSDVRSSCPLPEVQRQNVKALSFGILFLYKDDSSNQWGDNLMKRVLRNREKYAQMHNYTLINANDMIDPKRPVAWSKLKAVAQNLVAFDYILYLDMDAVIMDLTRPLSDFVQIAQTLPNGNDIDLIMTSDWNGPNTGVWLARKSDWTRYFLELAWNQTQFNSESSPSGQPYPFEYEQRAFHFLLDTKVWRHRRLPRYSGDSAALRAHVGLLPQCAFNSYATHPFDSRGRLRDAQFAPGDFLIHFAGKKGKIKSHLMAHYLDTVEMTYHRTH